MVDSNSCHWVGHPTLNTGPEAESRREALTSAASSFFQTISRLPATVGRDLVLLPRLARVLCNVLQSRVNSFVKTWKV